MLHRRLILAVGFFLIASHAAPTCWAETPALEDASAPAEQPLDPRITPKVLAAFEKGSFATADRALPYRLLRPLTIEEGKTYPLVLFLHGKGERGDENQRQLIHGGKMFAAEAFRQRYPAYVLAPQCPSGTEPGTLSKKEDVAPGTEADRVWTWPLERLVTPTVDLDRRPTPQLAAVRQLVDKLRKELPIDGGRIYVCGLSMGGYATWELAAREPELWAAAVPICGASDPSHAARLARLPIWNLHGEMDSVIPVERSREMVRAINAAGGRVIYTEYPGVGHDCWVPSFESRHVWDWMFAQRR
jgi:predicted peptidase